MKKSIIYLIVLGNVAVVIAFLTFMVRFKVQEDRMNTLQPEVSSYVNMKVEPSSSFSCIY